MRIGPLSVCAAAVLAASLVVPAAADIAPPPTLYVSANPIGNNCSDTGPATYSQPLCHVQVAANMVVPGQTVIVDAYGFPDELIAGDVHITRSGAPGAPIVFKTGAVPVGNRYPSSATINSGTNAFTLDDVHDVAIDGFGIENTSSTGIVISNSSDITIDGDSIGPGAFGIQGPKGDGGIDVTGTSANVVISRSSIDSSGTDVSVGPGVTGTDVADDVFNQGDAVSVVGAANTDITNDTAAINACPESVFSVAGGATRTSLENNIAVSMCGSDTPAFPLISVAADSTAGTTADYNVTYAQNDIGIYSWGGRSFATGAQFAEGTGQGEHDRNSEQPLNPDDYMMPTENSPAVDSADANAPGVLPTDYNGSGPIDDPVVVNAGTGNGYLDRGAVEMQDPMTLWITPNTQMAPTGGTVVATLRATQGWAPITGYSVDFGDGTPPTASTSPTISHVYTVASDRTYQVTATVTDSLRYAHTTRMPLNYGIDVVPPTPLVPLVSAWPTSTSEPLHFQADVGAASASWSLESATCDFGDGSGVQQADPNLTCEHTYQVAGTYRITMTVTDAGGNTASGSKTVTARAIPVVQPKPGGGHCPTCY